MARTKSGRKIHTWSFGVEDGSDIEIDVKVLENGDGDLLFSATNKKHGINLRGYDSTARLRQAIADLLKESLDTVWEPFVLISIKTKHADDEEDFSWIMNRLSWENIDIGASRSSKQTSWRTRDGKIQNNERPPLGDQENGVFFALAPDCEETRDGLVRFKNMFNSIQESIVECLDPRNIDAAFKGVEASIIPVDMEEVEA